MRKRSSKHSNHGRNVLCGLLLAFAVVAADLGLYWTAVARAGESPGGSSACEDGGASCCGGACSCSATTRAPSPSCCAGEDEPNDAVPANAPSCPGKAGAANDCEDVPLFSCGCGCQQGHVAREVAPASPKLLRAVQWADALPRYDSLQPASGDHSDDATLEPPDKVPKLHVN